MKELQKMKSTGYVCRQFVAADPDTRLRKSMVRTVIAHSRVYRVWLPCKQWRVDIDAFIQYFTNIKEEPQVTVPRLRHYEESYYLLKRDSPNIAITLNEFHAIVHSGNVRIFKYGNRWVLNYDDLIMHCVNHFTLL